jgi:hypothetical protein
MAALRLASSRGCKGAKPPEREAIPLPLTQELAEERPSALPGAQLYGMRCAQGERRGPSATGYLLRFHAKHQHSQRAAARSASAAAFGFGGLHVGHDALGPQRRCASAALPTRAL